MTREKAVMGLRMGQRMTLSAAMLTIALASPLAAQTSPQAPTQPPTQTEPGPAPMTVQIAPPSLAVSSAMLGVNSPLGAQAAVGKPIFAQYVTEHHQSFVDGNHISRSSTSNIYRDGKGRVRREAQLSVPGMPAPAGSSATFVTIVDQQTGYGYVLNPQEMVAHRYDLNSVRPSYVARLTAQVTGSALLAPQNGSVANQPANNAESTPPASPAPSNNASQPSADTSSSHWRLHAFTHHNHNADAPNSAGSGSGSQLGSSFVSEEAGTTAAAPSMRIDQPFLAAPNPVRTENLGEQTILGFRARGTRVITTLPAGEIGNDKPIDIVSEQWFSPELEMVMRSMHRDPWAGEFTTSVTKLSRGEQPAALFVVPDDYKVVDVSSEQEHHVLDGRSTGGVPSW